jgi:Questin oxidase-like
MKVPTQRLLSDKTFFIEFQGYLSNHAKHAIVALDKLQAKPERIQEYWDTYTRSTPYNLEIEKVPTSWDQVQPIANQDEWEALRGQKQKWQEMTSFLEQELQDRFQGDTNALVKTYGPDLLGGISGALTHGIIHLGWGIDAGSDWMTLEGLAYLNYCHLGIAESQFQDDVIEEGAPLESMLRIAQEWKSKNLRETWIEAAKAHYGTEFHPELIVAGFQWQLAKVLADPHPVATHLPTWLGKTAPLEKVWRELYQTCVYVYLATRDMKGNGNFLVLHSLTSLWALEQVCRVIDDPVVERLALKHFYGSFVCLLAASSGGFPSVEALQKIQKEFPLTALDDKENYDWNPTVTAACKEIEEHNIKLAYVAKALWDRYDQWHGFSEAARTFTLTPNIGPTTVEYKA